MRPFRRCIDLLVPVGVLGVAWLAGVGAGGGRRAHAVDAFEIQVYDGTANAPGQPGLEVHVNHVTSGRREAAPPELPPHRQLHLTLEPSLGITAFWELGAYFQTSLRPDGRFDVVGGKLRSKLVTPPDWRPHLRLGLNFEVSRLSSRYEAEGWGAEARPIVAWEDARWLFALNPNLGVSLTGGPVTGQPGVTATVRVVGSVSLGAEYYADVGPLLSPAPLAQQEHYVFEVVNVEVRGFDINLGVGQGLTAASNALVAKMIVGTRFGEGTARAPGAPGLK